MAKQTRLSEATKRVLRQRDEWWLAQLDRFCGRVAGHASSIEFLTWRLADDCKRQHSDIRDDLERQFKALKMAMVSGNDYKVVSRLDETIERVMRPRPKRKARP